MNIYTKELVILSKIDKDLDSYTPQIEQINSKVATVENKLNTLVANKTQLSEIIADNNAKIVTFEEQIKELKAQLDSIKKKHKEIKTEKELTALSSEEHIAKDTLSYDNEEIERLNKINEVKEAELADIEDELKTTEEELVNVKESVASELQEIEDKKRELYKKREEQTRSIDQKILAYYEKIRKWAGNTAVVKVEKQACYGCYIKINDKAYNDLIKGEDIVSCPHCGRVLYVEVDQETTEA